MKVCRMCGKNIMWYDVRRLFCSNACRQRWYREKRKNGGYIPLRFLNL
jgi:endogenous inhibitor of DNA gyrase (YacG/DUF329 family)